MIKFFVSKGETFLQNAANVLYCKKLTTFANLF